MVWRTLFLFCKQTLPVQIELLLLNQTMAPQLKN